MAVRAPRVSHLVGMRMANLAGKKREPSCTLAQHVSSISPTTASCARRLRTENNRPHPSKALSLVRVRFRTLEVMAEGERANVTCRSSW